MIKTIKTIALNTFRETIRDRIFYSLIAFAVLTVAASLLAGSVSLGQDVRVIGDFSLTAILVFELIITLFIGTQLVWREIERKTVYLVLSKPVSREAFYLGKFFGLCLTLLVSGVIMGVIFLSIMAFKTHAFNFIAALAILLVILEAWLLTAVGLLFNSFTTPLASAIYTFCLALIGHSSTTIWLMAKKATPAVRYVLESVYYVFPNLEKFNLRNEVAFSFQPEAGQMVMILLYFVAYTVAVLLLGMAAFRRHEF